MSPKFRNVEEEDDIYTIQEFREMVEMGAFIDYDGVGELADEQQVSDIMVMPSTFEETLQKVLDTNNYFVPSHVVWYNR